MEHILVHIYYNQLGTFDQKKYNWFYSDILKLWKTIFKKHLKLTKFYFSSYSKEISFLFIYVRGGQTTAREPKSALQDIFKCPLKIKFV